VRGIDVLPRLRVSLMIAPVVMNWFRHLLPRTVRTVEHPFGRVEFDAELVRYQNPDGTVQTIPWSEVDEVAVVRTDEGPLSDDLIFTLTTADRQKGCAIPQSARGTDALVAHLEDLQGFSRRALTDAMGSTSSEIFTLWQRRK